MKRVRLTMTSDKAFDTIVMLIICYESLFRYLVAAITKYIGGIGNLLFPAIYIILGLWALKRRRLKEICLRDLFLILFFVISIYMSCSLYPENAQYINERLYTVILPCLPCFLLGLCLDINEDNFDFIGKWCCGAVVISVLYVFYYRFTGRFFSSDSMTITYGLLINTLFTIDYAFRKKTLGPWVCMILGVFFALIMGTRGPLVVEAAFFIICMWKYTHMSKTKKLVFSIITGISIFFFLFIAVKSELLLSFTSVLEKFGFSTRIIDFIITGTGLTDASASERWDIYRFLFEKLKERPILGYGVYGEWPLISWSAHNLYLELIFHYGFILGGLLLIAGVLKYREALKENENVFAKRFIVLLGCYVFINGIFGGSYINKWVFLLLGFCIRESRIKKKKRRRENEEIS